MRQNLATELLIGGILPALGIVYVLQAVVTAVEFPGEYWLIIKNFFDSSFGAAIVSGGLTVFAGFLVYYSQRKNEITEVIEELLYELNLIKESTTQMWIRLNYYKIMPYTRQDVSTLCSMLNEISSIKKFRGKLNQFSFKTKLYELESKIQYRKKGVMLADEYCMTNEDFMNQDKISTEELIRRNVTRDFADIISLCDNCINQIDYYKQSQKIDN